MTMFYVLVVYHRVETLNETWHPNTRIRDRFTSHTQVLSVCSAGYSLLLLLLL